jgi:hypothetical protein
MKVIKLMMMTLMMSLMVMVSFGQSLFKNTVIFNEFGDSTSSVLRNVSHGSFSNTATNNSRLEVHTDLSTIPEFNTFEEYSKYFTNIININSELSEDKKESLIKSTISKTNFKIAKELKGSIVFKLYEYNDKLAYFLPNTIGTIKVKINDNVITSQLPTTAFTNGEIFIHAYRSDKSKYIKPLIKYGYYDFNLTHIYDYILESKHPVEVVIYVGSSVYKFKIK